MYKEALFATALDTQNSYAFWKDHIEKEKSTVR